MHGALLILVQPLFITRTRVEPGPLASIRLPAIPVFLAIVRVRVLSGVARGIQAPITALIELKIPPGLDLIVLRASARTGREAGWRGRQHPTTLLNVVYVNVAPLWISLTHTMFSRFPPI